MGIGCDFPTENAFNSPLLIISLKTTSSATQTIAVSVDVKKIFSNLKLGSDFIRSFPKAIPSERNEEDNWQ